MRKLLPLALFAFAVPFVFAAEVPSPLAGARTVFINAHPQVRHEIRTAIAAELPSLRFVSKADEADIVLELRTHLTPTTVQTLQQAEVVQIDRYNRITAIGSGRPIAIRPSLAKRPTMVADGASGVVIRQNVATEIYTGVTSPFTPSYFAREFVKAYRTANPG